MRDGRFVATFEPAGFGSGRGASEWGNTLSGVQILKGSTLEKVCSPTRTAPRPDSNPGPLVGWTAAAPREPLRHPERQSSVLCLVSSVISLRSSVFCLQSSVFCLLSSVFCLQSSVFCLQSSVFCLQTLVFCLLSSVFCLLSSVFSVLSSVCSHLSAVVCLLSSVFRL